MKKKKKEEGWKKESPVRGEREDQAEHGEHPWV